MDAAIVDVIVYGFFLMTIQHTAMRDILFLRDKVYAKCVYFILGYLGKEGILRKSQRSE